MSENPRDDAPADAPVDTGVDAGAGAASATCADPTSNTNTRLLRALPAPVFTLAYGALIIAVVTGGIFLVDKVSSAEGSPPSIGKPMRPFNPAGTSVDNVDASVRSYLIADAKSARTATGVTLTGTMTDTAEASLSEFSGHVSRLLEQNCVDNMTVRTQDNLRINLWGYCYSSPGADAIEAYVGEALEGSTDSVTFSFYPGREIERVVEMTWFTDGASAADSVVRGWSDAETIGSTDKLTLTAYDPERVRVHETFAPRLDRDDISTEDVTGDAFREKWGLDPREG